MLAHLKSKIFEPNAQTKLSFGLDGLLISAIDRNIDFISIIIIISKQNQKYRNLFHYLRKVENLNVEA
jgi:hypothetical protein